MDGWMEGGIDGWMDGYESWTWKSLSQPEASLPFSEFIAVRALSSFLTHIAVLNIKNMLANPHTFMIVFLIFPFSILPPSLSSFLFYHYLFICNARSSLLRNT